jgi:hypothetical protein
MPITLAISGKPPFEVDAETITIGSDPAGTIALPGHGQIKPRHAQIRRVAGRWLVEAREAESIQVGNEPPARVHWLQPGDVIRLSSNGPDLVFQPPPGRPIPVAAPMNRQAGKSSESAIPVARPVPVAQPVPVAPPRTPPAPPPPAGPDPFAIEPVELASLKTAPTRDERLRVKPPPLPGERKPAPEPPKQRKKISPALGLGAGVLGAGVVAVAVWAIAFRGGPDSDETPRKTRPSEERDERPAVKKRKKTVENEKPANVAAAPADEKSRPAEIKPERPPGKSPAVSTAPAVFSNPERYLYAVVVRDAAEERPFRLGTAWAVAPQRLVTSAAVALAIEDLQKAGLTAVVAPAGGADEISVTGIRVPPAYRQAFDEAGAARAQLDEAQPGPPSSKQRKPAESAPSDDTKMAQARLDRAYASQARNDIGVLEVEQRLVHLLKPSLGAPVSAGDRLRLAGLPFPVDDYRSAEAGSPGRVEQYSFTLAPGAGGKVDPLNLTLDFSGELARRNWSGSPILNSAGKVVGVYSRPLAGSDAGSGADAAGTTSHAVTPIARLRDIAPELQ